MSTREHQHCRHFTSRIPMYGIGQCDAFGTEPAPSSATGFVPGQFPGVVFCDADATGCQRFENKDAPVISITAKRDAEIDRKIMDRSAHLMPEVRR